MSGPAKMHTKIHRYKFWHEFFAAISANVVTQLRFDIKRNRQRRNIKRQNHHTNPKRRHRFAKTTNRKRHRSKHNHRTNQPKHKNHAHMMPDISALTSNTFSFDAFLSSHAYIIPPFIKTRRHEFTRLKPFIVYVVTKKYYYSNMVKKYNIITLCGSTRFKDQFLKAQKELTLKGNIVISVGLFGHAGDSEVWENMDEGTLTQTKEMLDDMHKRKIDMSDEIFVINVGGYIGESTKSEIAYARARGKKITYLE